jgi:hypothetical protein
VVFMLYIDIRDGVPKRKRLKFQGWGCNFTDFSEIFWLFWAYPLASTLASPLRARMRWYVRVRVGLLRSFIF